MMVEVLNLSSFEEFSVVIQVLEGFLSEWKGLGMRMGE
jgi:hypothetical protein